MSEDFDSDVRMELPVPVGPEPAAGAPVIVGSNGRVVFCSLMPATEAEATALANALSTGGKLYKDSVGAELRIKNVILKAGCEGELGDGELRRYDVSIVVTDTGDVFGGASGPILRCLEAYRICRGDPPWVPPVVARVARTGDGLILELVNLGWKAPKSAPKKEK